MKTIAICVSVAVLTMAFAFGIFFLLGAFYSRTFNINKWTEDTLSAVSIAGGIICVCAGAAAAAATFEFMSNSQKAKQ